MQIAGCKDERLEAQDGLYTDRLAMGSFIPHIPHPHSAFFYPVSGILGELGYMSIGVGYTIPFRCCRYMGGSGETFAKPEQPGRTGCYLPAYVSENRSTCR